MKNIISFEDLDRYESILNSIRKIYSNIMNIPEYDMKIRNDDDFIHLGGLPFIRFGYENFIKKLENKFGLPFR